MNRPRIGFASQSSSEFKTRSSTPTAENAHVAVAAFRRALSLYLEPFARHLMGVIESRLVADPPPDEDEITKLTEAKTGLAGVPQLVEAGKLPDARLACKVAVDALDRPLEVFATAPNRLEANALQAASDTPAGSDVPDFPLPLPIDDSLPESPAEVERLVSRLSRLTANFDLLFQLIVMLVAVALGIQVLWAGNPTWGSTSDMFIALFWGLGLHSLATGATAYEGLSDLAGRFR